MFNKVKFCDGNRNKHKSLRYRGAVLYDSNSIEHQKITKSSSDYSENCKFIKLETALRSQHLKMISLLAFIINNDDMVFCISFHITES